MPGIPDASLSPLAELTMRWASGWVRSRGVPTPERTEWGLRIEVGSERELIRHLVLDPAPERTAELAETITEPRVWIKSPVAPSVLRPVLDADWVEDQPVFLMTWDVRPLPVRVPPGYTVRTTTADAVTHVVILAEDGSTAAQAQYGHADGHGTPDQVSTDPAHQRRGLGTALMSALANAAHEAGESESILAASLQGRALYESLGWKLQAPLAGFVYKP